MDYPQGAAVDGRDSDVIVLDLVANLQAVVVIQEVLAGGLHHKDGVEGLEVGFDRSVAQSSVVSIELSFGNACCRNPEAVCPQLRCIILRWFSEKHIANAFTTADTVVFVCDEQLGENYPEPQLFAEGL